MHILSFLPPLFCASLSSLDFTNACNITARLCHFVYFYATMYHSKILWIYHVFCSNFHQHSVPVYFQTSFTGRHIEIQLKKLWQCLSKFWLKFIWFCIMFLLFSKSVTHMKRIVINVVSSLDRTVLRNLFLASNKISIKVSASNMKW